MDHCGKAVKNQKHFRNAFLKNGKAKGVHSKVARCLQYICITALYQIVAFGYAEKREVLESRAILSKKILQKNVDDGKLSERRFKKMFFPETAFPVFDKLFGKFRRVQDKTQINRFTYQVDFGYIVYFKYLVLKSGLSGLPKKAEQEVAGGVSNPMVQGKEVARVVNVKEGNSTIGRKSNGVDPRSTAVQQQKLPPDGEKSTEMVVQKVALSTAGRQEGTVVDGIPSEFFDMVRLLVKQVGDIHRYISMVSVFRCWNVLFRCTCLTL